jgi:uncharacterized membrane protein
MAAAVSLFATGFIPGIFYFFTKKEKYQDFMMKLLAAGFFAIAMYFVNFLSILAETFTGSAEIYRYEGLMICFMILGMIILFLREKRQEQKERMTELESINSSTKSEIVLASSGK